MMTEDIDSIHLRRVEPARNMARYYRVAVEETLFGETVVRRSWGRIGSWGQTRTLIVDRPEGVAKHVEEIAARKRKRGYRDVPELRGQFRR